MKDGAVNKSTNILRDSAPPCDQTVVAWTFWYITRTNEIIFSIR